ncbi:hypothetical protein Q1695_005223 [Nippostrongylus brasiliensis]|nr:hypothetical protein Q1695_005223 [Nippostrongylus brasiliensis]
MPMGRNGSVGMVERSPFVDLMGYHSVNIKLGALCGLFSVMLLFCLLTSRRFRKRRMLIITLAVADTMNCIGIFLMGIHRFGLYEGVLLTGNFKKETSWTCAQQSWLLVKTIGDVWPPIVQIFMGAEQLCAAYSRWQSKRRSQTLVASSVVFVTTVIGLCYLSAFVSRTGGYVKYYCGRKATFGRVLSGFIYAHNVAGYASGVLLNSLAYRKMTEVSRKCSIESRVKDRRIRQVRSYLVVSTISTILVSIPNCLSMFSILITAVQDHISKPAVWATCINSGINLFVYLILDRELRQHVKSLWTRDKEDSIDMDEEEEEDMLLKKQSMDRSLLSENRF